MEEEKSLGGNGGFSLTSFQDEKFVYLVQQETIHVLLKNNMRKKISLNTGESAVLCVSSDQSTIFAGLESGSLKTWSKRTFKELQSLSFENPITALLVNNDLLYLGFESGLVKVLDRKTLEERHEFQAFGASVSVMKFLQTSDLLVIGGSDGWVSTWFLNFELRLEKQVAEASITSLYSDNEFLYVGCEDGLLVVSRLKSLEEQGRIQAHSGMITAIATDKEFIFTGSDDFTLKVFLKKELQEIASVDTSSGILSIQENANTIQVITDDHGLVVYKKPDIDWGAISTRDLRGFLSFLGKTRSNLPSSIHRRVCSLKAFFRFLHKEGTIPQDPADDLNYPKRPASLPKFLPVEEVKKLLDMETKDPTHRAIVEVLYSTGCRVTELCNMNLNDIDLEKRQIMIRGGKGGKDRMVLLSPRAAEVLDDYLKNHRPKLVKHGLEKGYDKHELEQAVFLSKRGKRISKRTVQHIVSQMSERVGIQHTTPHMLRHSMASHLTMENLGLRVLQNLLGHASLDTTQIYANVTSQHVKDEFDHKLPIK